MDIFSGLGDLLGDALTWLQSIQRGIEQGFADAVNFLAGLPAAIVNGFMGVLQAAGDGLLAVVTFMIAQLPAHAPMGLSLPSGWLVGYNWLNSFMPLSEALGFGLFFLVLHGAAIAWRLAVVIYHLIPKPFIGT